MRPAARFATTSGSRWLVRWIASTVLLGTLALAITLGFPPLRPLIGVPTAAAAVAAPLPPSVASGGGALILENSFVSSTGWVKPGDAYPFRVLVRNPTATAKTGVTVTVASAPGMSFEGARAAVGSGAATADADTVTWAVGTVPAAVGGTPAVKTLVVEARAATLVQDPELVWKNIATVATLGYIGGPADVRAASHGPKVIPPFGYDDARFGDRPFPVVPVDYADFSHRTSAAVIDETINSPANPSSTYNLYQEMSLGQLFPQGAIPSVGVATRPALAAEDLRFSTLVPGQTCTGATTATPPIGSPPGTPGSPGATYTQRIRDGWYQLPGMRAYYGSDANGSALVGALAGVGALQQIDSGCGPTAKIAYDAAVASDPDIDFSDFDTDKDAVVDFFEIIFQGRGGNGESQIPDPSRPADGVYDNIWPHSSSLEFSYTDPATGLTGYISKDQLRNLEGEPLWYTDTSRTSMTTEDKGAGLKVFVRVGPYNVNPETALDKASVISHEYGHSLGLPDFYSTGSRETYGDFNLMATDKSHNMDVFSKQQMGWIVPRVLGPGQRDAGGWRDSKVDIGSIDWVTPNGTPYTLDAANGDQGIVNAEAYVAKLPGRQLLDPAIATNISAPHVWFSGSGNDFGCAPERGHNFDVVLDDLTRFPAGTPVELRFKSFFDIEWDYDYGFVLTGIPVRNTTDERTTIQFQSSPSTKGFTTPASQNPNTNSCLTRYGNGLTGSSGSYTNSDGTPPAVDRVTGQYPASNGFVADSYDISEVAGTSGSVLRFSYSTDPGLARPGWFIDDLEVIARPAGRPEEVIFSADFETEGTPEDSRIYNGGCNEDLASGARCTAGWQYVEAGAEADNDHAYYLEMRDRSGFDFDGRGENDRGAIAFEPGVLLTYTDESHGYGNVGTDDPPAQTPLDSVPEPGSATPNLNDAVFTPAAARSTFTDARATPHVDNYNDPRRDTSTDRNGAPQEEPFLFDFDCLSFAVGSLDGATDNATAKRDLVGAVRFDVGQGCGRFNYGFTKGSVDPVVAPGAVIPEVPVAVALPLAGVALLAVALLRRRPEVERTT